MDNDTTQPLPEVEVPMAEDIISWEIERPQAQLSFEHESGGFWGVGQRIAAWRNRLHRRELELELTPFWRQFAGPLAVTTGIIAVAIMAVNGLRFFQPAPPHILFYYNALESKWGQVDKSTLLIAPIVVAVINAIMIKLVFTIFQYDHRLSTTICWLLATANILVIIACGQIYSLIL